MKFKPKIRTVIERIALGDSAGQVAWELDVPPKIMSKWLDDPDVVLAIKNQKLKLVLDKHVPRSDLIKQLAEMARCPIDPEVQYRALIKLMDLHDESIVKFTKESDNKFNEQW